MDENWLRKSSSQNMFDNNEANECDESAAEEDSWVEEDVCERPCGNFDTMLHPMDFREFNTIPSVAPAKNSTPLGLYRDIHSESL